MIIQQLISRPFFPHLNPSRVHVCVPVLDAGDDPLGLHPLDVGPHQLRRQERVLAQALEISPYSKKIEAATGQSGSITEGRYGRGESIHYEVQASMKYVWPYPPAARARC